MPKFAHMPLLRNANKSKISKRKNPAARLTWFIEQGYLPEALRNFLALLGYSMPDGEEVFSFDDMVEHFDWQRVNTVGPVFDVDKLDWLNGHYIRSIDEADLAERLLARLVLDGVITGEPTERQRALVEAATPLVQTRMVRLNEAPGMIGFLLTADGDLVVEDEALASFKDDAAAVLEASSPRWKRCRSGRRRLSRPPCGLRSVDGLGIKPKFAFGPLRVAVTGRRVSPPLFESMEILGRDSSLARLRALRSRLA